MPIYYTALLLGIGVHMGHRRRARVSRGDESRWLWRDYQTRVHRLCQAVHR